MKFSCEICNSKMSATKRLKDVKAADEGYFIICIVCRTDNKHLIGKELRCSECNHVRFSRQSEFCRYHWRKNND